MSAISKTRSATSNRSGTGSKIYPKSANPARRPSHGVSECGHKLNNRPIHSRSGAYDNKQMIQIVTQDQIRDLLIPSTDPNAHPTIWPKDEFERIERKAWIKSFQDHLEEMNRLQQEKQNKKEESEKRKAALREIDRARTAKKAVEPQVEEEENLHMKILDRAFLAKQEQEEEVKRANRLILATKCHVIRDAQIAEKNEIQKELKNEELKLEKIMLEKAEAALKEEDKKREITKKEMEKHSEELRKQLQEKELIRLKEAERIEEESKKIRQAMAMIRFDEQEKLKQRHEHKKKIQKDLQKAKELSTYFKQREFEDERKAELKMAEYMRQRREREAQQQLEARIAKEARDRDHERLLQIQQKILDTKSQRETIVLRRGQEQVEREYRRKEKEAAIKKKEMEREIAKARAIQLEETKRQRALEIAKDEMDFKTTVDKLKQDEEKLRQLERQKGIERKKYREEIMQQMTEREKRKKEIEAEAKKAYLAAIEAEKNREKTVKSVIAIKIKQMKETNIPERFVKDVEKQLNVVVN